MFVVRGLEFSLFRCVGFFDRKISKQGHNCQSIQIFSGGINNYRGNISSFFLF